MKQKQLATTDNLQTKLIRVARVHYIYAAAFVIQVIIYDAWQLIPPAVVLKRWIMIAALVVATTIIWYLAHIRARTTVLYKILTILLIIADIAIASFCVYTQRGMASRAVALYVVPLIVAAILASRTALLATATLCTAAYVTTAVSYFVLNFNEGYKIELYGEIGFYSAVFFVVAALLWTIIRPPKS